MEQRIRDFHDEAAGFVQARSEGRPFVAGKAAKAMRTLQRFLFRNQQQRFSDSDKARLFSAVQSYYLLFGVGAEGGGRSSGAGGAGADDSDGEAGGAAASALPLVEDALKVSVFTPKQKATMLKWYEAMLGSASGSGSASGRGGAAGGRSTGGGGSDDDDGRGEWVFESDSDGDGAAQADAGRGDHVFWSL
ncbi:hypothetical protein HK105_201217 [Polyrhizophydium stewartii]|uniref:Uncharacterized protein n=1 Tax=Polyrhizophydium stewartii TaxID=2732419 RepID=A0ABR4NHK8_9FUNG